MFFATRHSNYERFDPCPSWKTHDFVREDLQLFLLAALFPVQSHFWLFPDLDVLKFLAVEAREIENIFSGKFVIIQVWMD